MRARLARVLAHVWLAIGVLAIVGSLLGGLALALDRSRARPPDPGTNATTRSAGPGSGAGPETVTG